MERNGLTVSDLTIEQGCAFQMYNSLLHGPTNQPTSIHLHFRVLEYSQCELLEILIAPQRIDQIDEPVHSVQVTVAVHSLAHGSDTLRSVGNLSRCSSLPTFEETRSNWTKLSARRSSKLKRGSIAGKIRLR